MKQQQCCMPVVWSGVLGAGLSLALVPLAQATESTKESPLLVRVTALVITTDASSDNLDLDVKDMVDAAVDGTYFFARNLAINVLATLLTPEVKSGNTSLGSVGLVPPILTLQYHFNPGPTSFYVGGGINYNFFYGETGALDDINGAAAGGHVKVKDTLGYVGQVGAYLRRRMWSFIGNPVCLRWSRSGLAGSGASEECRQMGDQDDDARVREDIGWMFEQGLETQWRDRAYTSEAVNEIIGCVHAESAKDLPAKLRIAGFTLRPYVSGEGDDEMTQACETCMYYVVHRQFCELPELRLPVKPEWSCRLWRI